jgi:transcriptional regulator with XRE-family HTH domain
MNLDLKKTGNRVKECREKAGLSQRSLAERLEVAPSTVSLIEQGKVNFTVSVLVRLATEFRASPDWLLGVDSPAAAGKRKKDLQDVLSGCSPEESETLIRMAKEMKKALRSAKKMN